MSFSLIVPIAANNPEYREHIPHVFQTAEDGMLLCIKAIIELDLNCFDGIYYTILNEFDKQYALSERLKLQFKLYGIKGTVVVLENSTTSQPDTVYQTILKKRIKGSIFIKDADCSFRGIIQPSNSVAIYPLEQLKYVNPQDKSYVSVDDMNYITNIIEKRVISHYFSAGGYCFENVDEYKKYYLKFNGYTNLYLSHIIYSMVLDKHIFCPIEVKNYQDFDVE